MNKLKLVKILSVLLLTFCAVNSAQANGIVTLADLVNQNGSITVDDKVFSGWTVSQLVSDNSLLVNLANIEVTGLPAPGGNPLTDPGPGLAFTVLNNAMSVAGNDIYSYLDFTVSFWATVTDPNNYIKDVSLSLTGFETTGNPYDMGVYINEDMGDAANTFLATTNVGANFLDGVATSNGVNGVSFAPQSKIYVTKNILVWSASDPSGGPGGTFSLTGFEQHFSQAQATEPVIPVSEPAIMLLLSFGFLGAGFAKRRQV